MAGEGQAASGWLVVDKPVGPTSAAVVGMLKRALRAAGTPPRRIGHGGTLDPLASGVLPIALGEATKLAGALLNGAKSYRFTLAFGAETDSGDREGKVVAESSAVPGAAALSALLPRFTGPIRQRPPAHSAIRIDGRRAYRLARAGEAVSLPERDITIHSLALVAAGDGQAMFDVRCSKGTYIRSLAVDLARAAGSCGHVTDLRRTGAGRFTLADSLPLDKLLQLVQGGGLEQALMPLAAGLDDIPVLAVEPDEARALKQGKRLSGPRVDPGRYLATLGSVPVALVRVSADDVSVVRGLNL